MSGHVFVIDGDVSRMWCDAWLLPTDDDFAITSSFSHCIPEPHTLFKQEPPWREGERVRPLRTGSPAGAPEVWLGNVGHAWETDGELSEEKRLWLEGAVEQFAGQAKEQVKARGPMLRLAVNALGTGHGGFSAEKGTVHDVLLPSMHRVAEQLDVDFAFVTWGQRAYAAAQQARAKVIKSDADSQAWWQFDHESDVKHSEAARLAAQARAGQLVLFLGAGASAGANLPTWSALIDQLAMALGSDCDLEELHQHDVRDQAAILDSKYAEREWSLEKAVRDAMDTPYYSMTHGLLASMRIREAVTTNYDNLYETAIKAQADQSLAVLPYEPVRPGGRWLLKLHGSADRPGSLVFTRDDYLGAPLTRGALFGIVQALLMTRHMLFIGYSLSDETFHQLLHEVRVALGSRTGSSDDKNRLGTALALFDEPMRRSLFSANDLHLLAMLPSSEKSGDRGPAARQLEIFIDLVAYLSADRYGYLLDKSYETMLTDDVSALQSALLELSDSLPSRPRLPEWEVIADLLHRFGHREKI